MKNRLLKIQSLIMQEIEYPTPIKEKIIYPEKDIKEIDISFIKLKGLISLYVSLGGDLEYLLISIIENFNNTYLNFILLLKYFNLWRMN